MIRAWLIFMLRGYKAMISPMLPNACRFVPTCSEYAMEAIERYGAVRGGLKAVWRLLRCHPFAQGGVDPVIRIALSPEEPAGRPACVCESRDVTVPDGETAVPSFDWKVPSNALNSVRRC